MTTAADLIAEARHHLLSGKTEELNKLANDAVSGATSLTFQYDLKGIVPGATIAIGLELFHVWDINAGTLTATVAPGHEGSTPAAHAAGSIVTVKPRFSDFHILKEINQDLADLSAPLNGLFQMKAIDITYQAYIEGYDLAGIADDDLLEVYELRSKAITLNKQWPEIKGYTVSRVMASAEFPSTNAIFIYEPAYIGQPIRVRYKAPFDPLVNLADNVASVSGLHEAAHDLPPMGAALRLAVTPEIRRNFTEGQGDTRRASEVPPGARRAAPSSLGALRDRRIAAEAARLRKMFPVRNGKC